MCDVWLHLCLERAGSCGTQTTGKEDLDYAEDVALISSRFADLQEKTDRLVATNETLKKQEVLIKDATSSIKVILWESYVNTNTLNLTDLLRTLK